MLNMLVSEYLLFLCSIQEAARRIEAEHLRHETRDSEETGNVEFCSGSTKEEVCRVLGSRRFTYF